MPCKKFRQVIKNAKKNNTPLKKLFIRGIMHFCVVSLLKGVVNIVLKGGRLD